MPANTYPTRQLGANGPKVSALGFGAMSFGTWYGKADEEEASRTLTYAADRGITFWDTSDAYEASEATIGKWFAKTGRRKEIFLATKVGACDLRPEAPSPWAPNSKPSYVRQQIENSFKALQTDYIDLYYQHRVDPEVPIEVVLETFRPYVESGKIKWLGLSECSVNVLKRAKAVPGVGEKVIVCQMEYSPFTLDLETNGFAKAAHELGVGIVAYSPLGRGIMTGQIKSPKDLDKNDLRLQMPRFQEANFAKNLALVDAFRTVADKYGATPGQIALAWILAVHPDFVPIPGTKSVKRLEENAKAAEIVPKEEDVKALREAVDGADVKGERYPAEYQALMQDECIELSEWNGE